MDAPRNSRIVTFYEDQEQVSELNEEIELKLHYMYELGTNLLEMGNNAEALVQFQKCLFLRPSYVRAINGMGVEGDLEGSLCDFQRCVKLNDKDYPSWNNLGFIQSYYGNYKVAETSFQQALKFSPKNYIYRIFYNMADYYNRIQKKKLSLECYTNSIRCNSKFSDAYNNRALIFCSLGDFQKALDDINRAILFDKEYLLFNNRGYIFMKMGNFKKGEEDLSMSISLNDSFPKSYYKRGICRMRLGQLYGAMYDFQRVFDMLQKEDKSTWVKLLGGGNILKKIKETENLIQEQENRKFSELQNVIRKLMNENQMLKERILKKDSYIDDISEMVGRKEFEIFDDEKISLIDRKRKFSGDVFFQKKKKKVDASLSGNGTHEKTEFNIIMSD